MFGFFMNLPSFVFKCLQLGVFLLCFHSSMAQVHTDTLTQEESLALKKYLDQELKKSQRQSSFKVMPSIYYTPETDFAFGAVGIFQFKIKKGDSLLRQSQLVPSIIFTLNDQLLSQVQFDLYWNTHWSSRGRVGYMIYPYFYSGIGNAHDGEYKEWYDAKFPVFEADLYRKVSKHLAFGVHYNFQNTKITSSPDSLIGVGNVPGETGSTLSSVGIGFNWITRNHALSATQGWYVNGSAHWADKAFGGSYSDTYLKIDIRKYIPIFKKRDVLALQLFTENHFGEVPFNLMALLGGSEQMRGYRQGIYRDRQMVVYQAEYRSRLYFKYFGFVLFGNLGGVGDKLAEVNENYRYTLGAGLRYAPIPDERYFFRLDYGVGTGTQGLYISVGEAF